MQKNNAGIFFAICCCAFVNPMLYKIVNDKIWLCLMVQRFYQPILTKVSW